MTNDVRFEIMGFNPNYEIRKLISSVADKLQLNAPSDSAMKLVFRKSKNGIQASCRIASQAGVFVAETISDNPVRAAHQLEKKIRKQLDRWKARRFEKQQREYLVS